MQYVFEKLHIKVLGIILQIVFIFVIPIFILYFGILPLQYRLYILALFSTLTLLLVLKKHYTTRELGLRMDNITEGIVPYTIFTLVGSAVILTLAVFLDFKALPNWYTNFHLVFLFLPISAAQEFLYRGFLIPETEKITKNIFVVIAVNTILFTFLHIFYANPNLPYGGMFLILPLGIASGLGFSLMYHRYPNLYLVSASHAVLNFLVCLFPFLYP
jgi:membrane protease YdiL (CAAX protease family)